MQRGNLRFLDPKEMYASNLDAQKKLDEVGRAPLDPLIWTRLGRG